jgi:hypothetical protein
LSTMSKKARFQFAEANQFLAFASGEVSRYFLHCQEGAYFIEEKSTWCIWLSHPFICEAFAERLSGDRLLRLRKSHHLRNFRIAFKPSQQCSKVALTHELRSVSGPNKLREFFNLFDCAASCLHGFILKMTSV